MLRCMAAGRDTAAKGPVEVEAAAAARGVQRFAYKIKPGNALYHKAVIRQLGKSHAASGGLGLLPAQRYESGKLPILKRAGKDGNIGMGEAGGELCRF